MITTGSEPILLGVRAYLYGPTTTLDKSASRLDDTRLRVAVSGSWCVGNACPIGSNHLRTAAVGVVQLAKPEQAVVGKRSVALGACCASGDVPAIASAEGPSANSLPICSVLPQPAVPEILALSHAFQYDIPDIVIRADICDLNSQPLQQSTAFGTVEYSSTIRYVRVWVFSCQGGDRPE